MFGSARWCLGFSWSRTGTNPFSAVLNRLKPRHQRALPTEIFDRLRWSQGFDAKPRGEVRPKERFSYPRPVVTPTPPKTINRRAVVIVASPKPISPEGDTRPAVGVSPRFTRNTIDYQPGGRHNRCSPLTLEGALCRPPGLAVRWGGPDRGLTPTAGLLSPSGLLRITHHRPAVPHGASGRIRRKSPISCAERKRIPNFAFAVPGRTE